MVYTFLPNEKLKPMNQKPVYILGGYQTDFARNWSKENKHMVAMIREVLEGGIMETLLPIEDINAAFVANFAGELYVNQGLLGAFLVEADSRLTGIPSTRVEAACASGSVAILNAIAFIQAGIYDVVWVVGVEQMKTVGGQEGSKYLGRAAWYEKEAKDIDFPFPKLFGRLVDVYDKRYGIETKYLAAIAEKNYANAKRNPNAQTRNWYMSFDHANTIGEYNRILSGKLRLTDCSHVTDGAVSLFLASSDYTKKHAKKHNKKLESIPRILGWGQTTAPVEFDKKIRESEKDNYVLLYTRKAILHAFKKSGVKNCWDLDLVETHDCFTSAEYMAIDHFGLTAPGESWKAIENGVVNFNGKLPFNPSGGLIGVGHPVGATGVRQILDAFKQVNNTAKDYQIENARKVATLNIGGSATTNVCMIIGK